VASAARIES